jgi:hypothetical protein
VGRTAHTALGNARPDWATTASSYREPPDSTHTVTCSYDADGDPTAMSDRTATRSRGVTMVRMVLCSALTTRLSGDVESDAPGRQPGVRERLAVAGGDGFRSVDSGYFVPPSGSSR